MEMEDGGWRLVGGIGGWLFVALLFVVGVAAWIGLLLDGGLFVCDCVVILLSLALSHLVITFSRVSDRRVNYSSSISKFKMGNEKRRNDVKSFLSHSKERHCHNEPRGCNVVAGS